MGIWPSSDSSFHTLSRFLEQGLCIHHEDDALGLSRCAMLIDPLQMLWIAALLILGPLSEGLLFISSFDVRLPVFISYGLWCDYH